jgi:hypothetical protein
MESITKGVEEMTLKEESRQIGVVYDKRCLEHSMTKHFHQETPKRLEAVLKTIETYKSEDNINI